MRNDTCRRVCALGLLLLLIAPCAVGLAQAADESGNLFRVGGHTIALPEDWSVIIASNGKPQLQFVDADGKRGICVILASRVEVYSQGLDADGLLAEVCKALGGDTYQLLQVGERRAAMFDVLQDIDKNITHAVFMEDMDVYLIQLWLEESANTMRQQMLATEVVGLFNEGGPSQ